MSSEIDREHLLGLFLAEAADGMRVLSEALSHAGGEYPAPQRIRTQGIIARRVKDAAALHGYGGIAGLCERLEALCERAAPCSDDERRRMVAAMRDMVEGVQSLIRAIGNGGGEDRSVVERCVRLSADWFASAPIPGASSGSLDAGAVLCVGGTSSCRASRAADPPQAIPPSESDAYFAPHLDPEVMSYFGPEAQEYLETLESGLLRLDKDPQNRSLIDQLFRTAHTLKGSAYTVGFQAVGDLMHHVEDFMGAVRDHRLTVMPGYTDVMLRAVDVVHALMRGDSSVVESTRRRFWSVLSDIQQMECRHTAECPPSGGVGLERVAPSESAPEFEEPHGPVGRSAAKTGEERSFVRVGHARLEQMMNLVGELVIGRGRLEQRLKSLERCSDHLSACKARMTDSVQSFADTHLFTLQPVSAGRETQAETEGVRACDDFSGLELDTYDEVNILARRIGEIGADMTEAMAQFKDMIRRAQEDMEGLQQLTGRLRDEIGRARMVPVGVQFTRFRRAVREAARSLGKQVSLVTSGDQIEVDAGIVEGLVDPLVHLIRNAVYHGIETPAERVARGKPPAGTIYLRAENRGHSIAIEVEDDGAGLDFDKIRDKAVAVGLVRPEQAALLSERDVIEFIFAPGFSTAGKVGEQAGRGVGLDVARRAVEDMHGRIEVESRTDSGTKFILSLPLTLVITTALLVRVGGERYAIALSHIREVASSTRPSTVETEDHAVLHLNGEAIEVRSLWQVLHREPNSVGASMPVVIVRTAKGVLGLAVDELLGRQEIVIKPLGPLTPLTRSCFAGATIDSEGQVVLMVDPSRFEACQSMRAASYGSACAGASSAGASMIGPPQGGKGSILLIDDSLSIRKFVGRMLEGAGYAVDTAVDGRDGIRKASEAEYAVIITDLEMPRVNGYEVVQALRARQHTKRTPIIVMTTRAGEKHRRLALETGASSYLAKPVEERTLLDEVERWVRTTTA